MIETNLGTETPNSPMQHRPWLWGGDGIIASRSTLDNTVLVTTDRTATVEFEENTTNQYVPPP